MYVDAVAQGAHRLWTWLKLAFPSCSLRLAFSGMAAAPVRRRLQGKQPAQAAFPVGETTHVPTALRALADEGWSELTGLSEDTKRKHMHWVHVRTHNPLHRQPDSFTREAFWSFLRAVYKDVYPEVANAPGSIHCPERSQSRNPVRIKSLPRTPEPMLVKRCRRPAQHTATLNWGCGGAKYFSHAVVGHDSTYVVFTSRPLHIRESWLQQRTVSCQWYAVKAPTSKQDPQISFTSRPMHVRESWL